MKVVLAAFTVCCMLLAAACKTPEPISAVQSFGVDCQPLSTLSWMKTYPQQLNGGDLRIRVGVKSPGGTPKGDILFLHGFADRIDNHQPLFDSWAAAGFRVLAFDFPSHGETCGSNSNIDHFGFTDLADIAKYVESSTLEDTNRPLLLAGWSTGGLLAVRMLQSSTFPSMSRPIKGAILFAPGVSVYSLVGESGSVTQASLTNNPSPPHYGTITPGSPLHKPLFATKLLTNAQLSWQQQYPEDKRTLVIVADDDQDMYAKSADLRGWVASQRTSTAVKILGVQCAGAKHELDNEPAPIGPQVRKLATAFALTVVDANAPAIGSLVTPPCGSF